MDGTLLGQLKFVSTFFIFFIERKHLIIMKNDFYLTKKAPFFIDIDDELDIDDSDDSDDKLDLVDLEDSDDSNSK